MPISTTDDQRAVAAAVRHWARRANPIATTRAQESATDAWRKHWHELAELGIFSIAVPQASGGAGGSVADLAVAVEAAAEALVPGPLVTTALVSVLLGRSPSPGTTTLLAALGSGTATAAIAIGPSTIRAKATDSGLIVTGSARLVLGADPRCLLLVPVIVDSDHSWVLVDAESAGVSVRDLPAADFSRSLARVDFDEVRVAADRRLDDVSTDLVTDLLAVLAAAEASGVSAWCLRTAVDYAKVREQFGKPIGSFQAIKHLCAEMLCRAEVATAVAWDCAAAAGDSRQLPLAAAVAAATALDSAVQTAKDCIQVLGGIGFTWEHDAHLYLRRAVATRQLMGGGSLWRRRATELTLGGARRELHIDLGSGAAAQAAAVRDTVAAIAALTATEQRSALATAGYLAPHWPAPYGLDAGAELQVIIDQELARAGITRPDLVVGAWAVPTILKHGTPEQVEQFVPATLRGDLVGCQLFSEPGAGADLAALRTRAERVDGGWRLTGQKVWTSVAQRADWGICLARTNRDAPKHKGISYFLVDMRSAGLDIRPLREITGDALFNEVFLDRVFVPDAMVVGRVDEGWALARTTLVNERIAMSGGSSLGEAVEHLVDSAARAGLARDAVISDRLGALIGEGLSGSLLELRAALGRLSGKDSDAESSVRKLVGVRHRQSVAEFALEMLGHEALADTDELRLFLNTRCLTIAGGTSQVLLTLAAERILGLPRA
ncbi:MAG: acyl-CoA dehydrogenase [Actinomycetota bacterium]|nr:acyl-CoA dehydrogenase [Actinomycetota bacterium]